MFHNILLRMLGNTWEIRYPFVFFLFCLMQGTTQDRIMSTLRHIKTSSGDGNGVETEECKIRCEPYIYHREEDLKWNGWGYSDTDFCLGEEGEVVLTGNKYSLSGKTFPKFRSWIEGFVDGINVDEYVPPQTFEDVVVPERIINQAFLDAIEGRYGRIESDKTHRLRHAHGQTAQEVYLLRYGKYERIPDVVVWPINHDQVQFILEAAKKYDVCVIPFGGGTSVSEAVICPTNEPRMIVSLDMKMMNGILWVDRESMMACIQAGIVGRDLESRLNGMDLCLGHEPDSHEFSTLGGWVATRASGMKKNRYGNIEDMVVHIRLATPTGTVEKSCRVPRISAGPDIHEMILGSEGILGVITEVTVTVQLLPEARAYGSIVFPDFDHGVTFMREVALKRAAPVSIRLMDNTQFQMGQCLTPEDSSHFGWLTKNLKDLYLTKWAKFDLEKMVACTVLFEGDKDVIEREQKTIYALADKHGGINAGQTNGRKGYFLTFMIAYLRDYSFGYWLIGESFETSIPWANVPEVCYAVTEKVESCGDEFGLPWAPMCSYRISQLYDTGPCVYFYFGFIFRDLEDPVKKFNQIENLARETILSYGGSISHHHGVGKLRKQWLGASNSPLGNKMVESVKRSVDPTNVLGCGNLIGIVGPQKE